MFVKRALEVLKKRFKMIALGPAVDYRVAGDLIVSCACLHNLILQINKDDFENDPDTQSDIIRIAHTLEIDRGDVGYEARRAKEWRPSIARNIINEWRGREDV